MDRNFFLALALSFLVLSVWSLYMAPPPEDPEAAPPIAEAPAGATGSFAQAPPAPGAPAPAPGAVQPGTSAPFAASPSTPPPTPAAVEEFVEIETDLYRAVFTSRGGALKSWELKEYDDASLPGRPQVEMTTVQAPGELALVTPLESLGFGDQSHAPWSVSQPSAYEVAFTLVQGGIEVRKLYTLSRDGYDLSLRLEFRNDSERHIAPTFRVGWPAAEGRESQDFQEFSLVALSDGDLEQALLSANGGPPGSGLFGGGLDENVEYTNVDWAGAQTRYFLAAIIPDAPRDAAALFTPSTQLSSARADVAFKGANLPPGQTTAREYRIYLGPKEKDRLDAIGARLDESILKGWFPALTNFFTWLLEATHNIVPNYGWAIILITVLVRLLMYPVMQKQMKSMKRMSAMQPKMKEIQEQYAEDKERQSQEMMKLYKESGFNPLTGCLPMFLQLPVFIGLYYALQGAIQLRQEPFLGWITDLSAPESLFMIPGLELPFRVLPLLMGLSMVVQTRLTPTTMDPAQARMMNTVMPVMFTVLFYQFASGLVLYWLVSNVLGIGQQLLTQRSKD